MSLSLPPKIRLTTAVPLKTAWPLMPDGSTALRARYWIAPSALRRSNWFSSQSVFGSSFTEPAPVMTGRPSALTVLDPLNGAVMPDSSNLQSAVANASCFRVCVPVVLRSIISENELPSSWVRRFMPGVRFR